MSAAESVTVVEPASSHMVQMLWEEYTIHLWCGCGWTATVSDPAARDCVGQRLHFRAAEQLSAGHQYPDLSPAQAGDALACELWSRLLDWPVDAR